MSDQPQDFVETAPAVQQISIELPDTLPVQDLDQFVGILTGWHTNRTQRVRYLLTAPEGSQFVVGDGPTAETITLTGDTLKGFKFGLEMALMQLGTLPFAVELEDAQG